MTTHIFKDQRVPVRRRVRLPDTDGFTSVADGHTVGDLEITIDLDAIVRYMGARALNAKSRTCRDGFVVVRARNIRHEP